MMVLVNKKPVDDDDVEKIRQHDILGMPWDGGVDTIVSEDLDETGKRLLRKLRVEGQPAHGITMHNTKWGRAWCAFRHIPRVTPNTHGGKREGAGRKPAPDKKVIVTIRLSPAQKAWLDEQGARNAARIIRELIDRERGE